MEMQHAITVCTYRDNTGSQRVEACTDQCTSAIAAATVDTWILVAPY